jgi:hypothetical protein
MLNRYENEAQSCGGKLRGNWTEYRQKTLSVKTLPATKFEAIAYDELRSNFCVYVLIKTGLYRVF